MKHAFYEVVSSIIFTLWTTHFENNSQIEKQGNRQTKH